MSDSFYLNLLPCSSSSIKHESQLSDINQFRAKLCVLPPFCEKKRRYRNKESGKLMNSFVSTWIFCHHYKRQIREKTRFRPIGSLVRGWQNYFFCFILEIFLFDKNFLLNSQCGVDVCCLSRCFPREAVCFCLFLVTQKLSIIIHSLKMYHERSRNAHERNVLLFSFHCDFIYTVFTSLRQFQLMTREREIVFWSVFFSRGTKFQSIQYAFSCK